MTAEISGVGTTLPAKRKPGRQAKGKRVQTRRDVPVEIDAVPPLDGAIISMLTGMHTNKLRELERDGLVHPDANGRYDLTKTVRAICIYLTARLEESAESADLRLKKAKATIAELDATKRQGASVDLAEANATLASIAAKVRTRVLSVPSRAATLVIAEDAAGAHAILKKMLEEALHALAADLRANPT